MFIFLNKYDYFAFAAVYVVAFLKHAAPEFVGRNMWRNVKKTKQKKQQNKTKTLQWGLEGKQKAMGAVTSRREQLIHKTG